MKKGRKILGIAPPIAAIVFCLMGFLIAPNDPHKTTLISKFLTSDIQYPFGTDELGRCVFSRILYGGTVTVGIVLLGSAIVAVIGTVIGIVIAQGSTGKNLFFDSLLNAVTAIPPIAYLIIFIGIWGNSIPTMLVSLTASLILRMIKLVKTKTELEFGKAYILCAIASGASKLRLLFVHILPNIAGEIIRFVCLSCAEMILTISGFSFIGLSLGDDVIDWGIMLSDARSVAAARPMLMIYPIVFIFICALSFNLLARRLEKGGESNA